ncbi:hypothetical protein F7725_023779 [Dissostichus mawsoni]|uniref:Uncharacterized protein n=1 Tax=Dissostichus mawsoni TaxID=36200 RepID=A0A7J5Y0D4_DISMA|nr:hypothetical protein F7725_023779 [Dissostichus mawsoni]
MEKETEDMTDGVSEDKEESVEEANIEIAQLQGLVAELREGFHAALTELCELRQRDHGLEEKLQAHQIDVDDKIMGLKNSLNTFKEELNMALFHIKDVSNRQREPLPQSRRLSSREVVHPNLQRGERGRTAERSLRDPTARLKTANISFNGSEAPTSKDKRPFPSTLRFLIQQHLELLHTLQERVLKCQWQGIMGDVFMRLTSKESDFLDFYVSYLKELPDCVTALAAHSAPPAGSEDPEYLLLLQGLLRQTTAEHPDYYLLLVCIQQFRSFTTQYHHLLQHNQELLLLHNRKEVKRPPGDGETLRGGQT